MVGGRGAPLINLGAQGPPTRKIFTSLSVHDSVHLKKSGNAWKPGMKRESLPAEPESHITQDLFKKGHSILNKVTPEKFNHLMKQVWDLTIETEERLKGVVDLVFEKAIDEPSFSVTYGNMCGCLATVRRPLS
ncbi:eukaryotic translation initiation factor 4 gamma 3-like [Platichthys flesus]|uniref:eukaryotic translation initiation factor 4 gamma 3-like n=1 Tax=Platichthys flesus TaxID=8260 RepID=UPI002DBB5C11|nr:eukaryotic translation initiation factor 4 gamma 3-like [Platichthys flesus]